MNFQRIAEVMNERSQPENLVTTIIQLVIVVAIASTPFIGVPLGLLAFLAIAGSWFI